MSSGNWLSDCFTFAAPAAVAVLLQRQKGTFALLRQLRLQLQVVCS